MTGSGSRCEFGSFLLARLARLAGVPCWYHWPGNIRELVNAFWPLREAPVNHEIHRLKILPESLLKLSREESACAAGCPPEPEVKGPERARCFRLLAT